ncbi:MAG: WGR domain-containing protein, partial [Candidatus Thiodiazotropha sp.]
MELVRTARLFFQDGKSDKVYEVDLCDLGASRGDAHYLVNFRYGRRGASLREGTKTRTPVNWAEAQKLFDSVVVSKTNKGYQMAESEGFSGKSAPAIPLRESSQDPRAQIILDRLRDACHNRLAPGAVKRTVWRAGELRLPDAASLIEQLAGQNDNLL